MGILDRFRPTQRKSVAANALAMVLLPGERILDASAVFDYVRAHWTDLPSVTDVETKEGATSAAIPGGSVGLVQIPMPVPSGDLAGPSAVAWYWPTAAEEIARHQSHVIVFAGSTTLSAVDLRLLHSKLVAAVAATTDAIGVYVGDAMLVRGAADYVNEARAASREAVPMMLWVGFNLVVENGTVSAYTTGLTGFGLPELEVRRSARPAPDVLGTMADAASYQLRTGRLLRHGDTFGFSESERIPIRHTRSDFLPNTTVAVLGL